MEAGFKFELDRQWRAAVVAISNSNVSKQDYERYSDVSDEKLGAMVSGLLGKIGEEPVALSFNAGSWVRSGPFHIKAFVTPEKFRKMLEDERRKPPNEDQWQKLKTRSSEIVVRDVANEFRKPTVKVDINGIECLRLADTVECKFPYLKLCLPKQPNEIREAVKTFEEWFVKQPRDGKGWDGFGIYLIPAICDKNKWDIFINIDPGQYKRIFQKAKTTFQVYEEPERDYRKKR